MIAPVSTALSIACGSMLGQLILGLGIWRVMGLASYCELLTRAKGELWTRAKGELLTRAKGELLTRAKGEL